MPDVIWYSFVLGIVFAEVSGVGDAGSFLSSLSSKVAGVMDVVVMLDKRAACQMPGFGVDPV
jgi:hypothetical protein